MTPDDLDVEDIRAARADEQRHSRLVDHGDPTVFEQVREAIDAGGDDLGAETARKLATELADERQGKLIKQASLRSAGMPVEKDGITDDEEALVEDLAARMDEWRESVLPDDPAAGGDDDA